MAVNPIGQPNAYLTYKSQSGQMTTFLLWVMTYSQPHQMEGSSHQSFGYKRYYPKSYAPGKVRVEGRLPNADQHQQLGDFIREHQRLLLANRGLSNLGANQLPLMNLGIPKEGFYVSGFIPNYTVERKRFNPAPEYTFEFEAIRDRHSTNSSIVPAAAIRSWWTGAVLDTGKPAPQTEQETTNTMSAADLQVISELEDVENIARPPILGTPLPGAGGRLQDDDA